MEKKPMCPLVCASAVCTSILYSLGKLPSMWHVGLSVGNIAYQKHDILVAPRVRAYADRDVPDDVEKSLSKIWQISSTEKASSVDDRSAAVHLSAKTAKRTPSVIGLVFYVGEDVAPKELLTTDFKNCQFVFEQPCAC
ncbi:hypothetical protein ACFOHT_09690 [Massilia oculi]|uniref:hypothetical protein n=1 Tax=Massilia oculi TaxID=945844 RepID=UPI0013B35EFE|nr:hypothetical protein [Massilia oculi]